MSTFQSPPVWELLIVEDPWTGRPIFSPVWLNWLVELSKNATALGAGNVIGPSSAVDGTVALFSGTSGDVLKAVSGLGDSTKVLTGNTSGAPTWQTLSLQRHFLLMGA